MANNSFFSNLGLAYFLNSTFGKLFVIFVIIVFIMIIWVSRDIIFGDNEDNENTTKNIITNEINEEIL